MNKKRIIWLVPVLVMALAMSACKNNDDGGKDNDPGYPGEELSWADEEVVISNGSMYTGPEMNPTASGGSGVIKSSKFTFNIGVPTGQILLAQVFRKIDAGLGHSIFSLTEVEPSNTEAVELVFQNLTHKIEKLPTPAVPSLSKRVIYYIYVDKDCTATAKDISPIDKYPYDEGTEVEVRVSKIDLKLKKGWNRVTYYLYATAATGGDLVIGKTDKKDLENCKWVYEK
jgi:hypothetical protein